MNSANAQLPAFPDSKGHYKILDGLRGVAAMMVVAFHVMETHSGGSHLAQIINHGYLAVDFFFVLSGFVIGYAYDDRWGKMTLKGFFKRRLIRLHPMIIMGMIVGAVTFYFQDGGWFGNIHLVPVWKMLLVMVIGFTLIPVPVSMDVRGWSEMHPLDGPAWSLFFEYIGNILYALFVRKFSKTLLTILVAVSGAALIHLAVTSPQGDVIGGWSITPEQLRIGFTRLMYPFFAGLLLSRIVKVGTIKNAFLWSSLLIIAVFSIPRIGGSEHLWMNGLYDSLSIIFVFPLVVYIGASGELKGKFASKLCKFLGDISYPIYITHYPLIYLYTSYVSTNNLPFSQSYPAAILLFVSSIALAYAAVRFYDLPVRAWLTKRFMDKKQNTQKS
jgi:peptidoglycan/LPS O-acetylase OafA/YrhL